MRAPAPPPSSHPPGAAFRRGARAAAGAPALAMALTFLAFGAAARQSGFSVAWALACSALVYGMAGQMVLLGPPAAPAIPPSADAPAPPGATAAGAVAGATAANARFLPMAVALAPLLAAPGRPRARIWAAAPFVAVTPWAAAMRALPSLPAPGRLPWFLGFGLASWTTGLAATAAGHAGAGLLGPGARAVLLYANPLYFALVLALGLGRPDGRRAVLAGLAAAPLVPFLPPGGGLLLAGLAGGTLAWALGRRGRDRGDAS